MNDVLGGQLDVGIVSAGPTVAQAKAGKIRVLATASGTRSPFLPDVPIVAESLPNYEVDNTYMLYIHAQPPVSIINVLNCELVQAVSAPELKEKMAADSALPGAPFNAAELKAAFAADYARWDGVMKRAGVKIKD